MKKISVIVPESVENYFDKADSVAATFATIFGGFNQYQGFGGWVDPSGALVKEAHTRIEAYGDLRAMNYPQRAAFIDALHLVLANQECIFVEYDGAASLLENAFDVLKFTVPKTSV